MKTPCAVFETQPAKLEFRREPVNERPEADALDRAADDDSEALRLHSQDVAGSPTPATLRLLKRNENAALDREWRFRRDADVRREDERGLLVAAIRVNDHVHEGAEATPVRVRVRRAHIDPRIGLGGEAARGVERLRPLPTLDAGQSDNDVVRVCSRQRKSQIKSVVADEIRNIWHLVPPARLTNSASKALKFPHKMQGAAFVFPNADARFEIETVSLRGPERDRRKGTAGPAVRS